MAQTSSKKYYWLRLKDDFFSQIEIKKLRRIAGGDTFTIIYLKMLLIAMKQDNKIYWEGVEDKFDEELALLLDEDVDNVSITLNYLKSQNLIEQLTEDEFILTKCSDMVGKETQNAERVRKHRQKKISSNKNLLQCNTNVTKSNTEIEIEIEIDKDINNIVHPDAPQAPSKKIIEETFKELWSLYPSKKGKANISDSNKKELYKHGIEQMKRAIQRYIDFVEQKRKGGFQLEYKNGSTFFKTGYVDYLDDNYVPEPINNVQKNNNKSAAKPANKFHNFNQTISEYSEKEMEEIAQRNLKKKLEKLGIGDRKDGA